MLGNVLNWLSSPDGGALAVILWVTSWGLEEFDRWHALAPKARQLIVLGLSAALAVGATVLNNNPQIVAAIDPYFTPIFYVGSAWLATQVAHRGGKALARMGGGE